MSAELHPDDTTAHPPSALEAVPVAVSPPDRRHPNLSGDLPTVLEGGPMFRRAPVGYDRFQVDSYVQWAEAELATAGREREHLMALHLRTQAALEEARELLSHSSVGGELLQLSRRIGSMLAAAADEAGAIRTEAEADRTAASAQAERMVAEAERVLVEATADAQRTVAEALTKAEEIIAEAGRIVDEAEQTRREAGVEAEARLEKVRAMEQRAVEDADRIRQRAEEETSAAWLQVREEVVRMLMTGRDERRRADDEAAAARARLDGDAVERRASLLAEIARLEARRAALDAVADATAEPTTTPSAARLPHPRRLVRRAAPPAPPAVPT